MRGALDPRSAYRLHLLNTDTYRDIYDTDSFSDTYCDIVIKICIRKVDKWQQNHICCQ